ncbi:hypothetical protein GCM10027418_28180 [Mariniluteicoccus endophyticus]
MPTPDQLRGLAHPVRLKMLGLLRTDGPQTATGLAAQLGLNSGATSYHLRQLATHGFVVEAPELGTTRERWWRAAHRSTRVEDSTSPAAGAFLQTVVVRHTQVLQESAEEFDELPDVWKQASTHSDWMMRLPPSRARALVLQISDLLTAAMLEADEEEDGASGDAAAEEDATDREQVMFQLHAFPRPGRIPHRHEPPGETPREKP